MKYKKGIKQDNDEDDFEVICNECGYKGLYEDFIQDDTDDTICPNCGEKDNHTYNID